jgi:hypothetical protein
MPRKAKAGRASASYSGKTRRIIKPLKPHYKKKPLPRKHPKYVDEQIKLAKIYKKRGKKQASALSRKYNKEVNKRYRDEETRRRIKKYRLTAKYRKLKEDAVILTAHPVKGRHKGEFRVIYGKYRKEKWLTRKQFSGLMYRTKRKAVIDHYKALYGLTTKEANELYKAMKGRWGSWVRAALY